MNKLTTISARPCWRSRCSAVRALREDSKPTNEEKLQQQKDSAQEPAKQETTGDLTKQEQEYLSALKKCESMNAADKQQCVEKTRKQFGHQ